MTDWQPIETAPYSQSVTIKTDAGRTFKATLYPDASMNGLEQSVDQWQADEGEKYPSCWSDGCCWESNADGFMSDQPAEWKP